MGTRAFAIGTNYGLPPLLHALRPPLADFSSPYDMVSYQGNLLIRPFGGVPNSRLSPQFYPGYENMKSADVHTVYAPLVIY